MSLGERVKNLQEVIDSANFYLVENYQKKTIEELIELRAKIEKEKQINLRLEKSLKDVNDTLTLIDSLIEYKMLLEDMKSDETVIGGHTLL